MPKKKKQQMSMMTMEQANDIVTLSDAALARAKMAYKLGQSGYGSNRDIYVALGYLKTLDFSHYYARYKRQGVAKRIIIAMPNACWINTPKIIETQGKETVFEDTWTELQRELKLYAYLRRVDKLAGIGRYGVLFMGFSDTTETSGLSHEVVKSNTIRLMYIRAFTEQNARVDRWDNDATSSNYGKPLTYKLQLRAEGRTSSITVHYSRIIHVTEDLAESEVYGEPVLESIYNYLQDLELVSGSAGEMWWRGAFPGLAFNIDADAEVGKPALASMKTEIDTYIHGLQRFLRLQGVEVKNLAPKVADPSKHIDMFYTLIASSKEMQLVFVTYSYRQVVQSGYYLLWPITGPGSHIRSQ